MAATLKTIRKRIVTVKSTQKITKAMKMVSAAKLRRAQMAVVASRPYAQKLEEVVAGIMAKSPSKHPLMQVRESVKRVEILMYTSNRGLCGGFNSNLLRRADTFIKGLKQQGIACRLIVIGKKGRDFFAARQITIDENNIAWAVSLTFPEAMALTQTLSARYAAGEFDEYYIIYNRFVSAMSQVVTIDKLLPFAVASKDQAYGVDAIYEPSKEGIVNELLPKMVANKIFKAHLESLASELGSRMSAMDNATKNASEMILKLSLKYNRARQAAITTELMDIVNGAESLK
jgi:F-type H+-transporting ATPase subunit gamma